MRAETIEQTAHFAAYAGSVPGQQHASRSVQPDCAATILVPALWSGFGLALSAPFVPLLSKAMAAEDTFSVLVGLLG